MDHLGCNHHYFVLLREHRDLQKAKVAIPAVAIVAVAIFFIDKYPPEN